MADFSKLVSMFLSVKYCEKLLSGIFNLEI